MGISGTRGPFRWWRERRAWLASAGDLGGERASARRQTPAAGAMGRVCDAPRPRFHAPNKERLQRLRRSEAPRVATPPTPGVTGPAPLPIEPSRSARRSAGTPQIVRRHAIWVPRTLINLSPNGAGSLRRDHRPRCAPRTSTHLHRTPPPTNVQITRGGYPLAILETLTLVSGWVNQFRLHVSSQAHEEMYLAPICATRATTESTRGDIAREATNHAADATRGKRPSESCD